MNKGPGARGRGPGRNPVWCARMAFPDCPPPGKNDAGGLAILPPGPRPPAPGPFCGGDL